MKIIPSQDLRKLRESQAKRKANLEADPTCRKCGTAKSISDFPPEAVDYWCYDCRSAYATALYRKKRDSLSRSALQAWRSDKNERAKLTRRERMARMSEDEFRAFRDATNARNRQIRAALRDETYRAYGGSLCACCGETERAFLSIDHVNNDGAKHRKREGIRTGDELYRWLKKRGFPTGFQVLCMNCQWGKRNNRGVCQHQSSKV